MISQFPAFGPGNFDFVPVPNLQTQHVGSISNKPLRTPGKSTSGAESHQQLQEIKRIGTFWVEDPINNYGTNILWTRQH